MALYISRPNPDFPNYSNEKQIHTSWHTGNKKPMCKVKLPSVKGLPDDYDYEPFDDVVEIQADGHELEYIRARFNNLPDCPNARVVTWTGDFAQFIYNHLV